MIKLGALGDVVLAFQPFADIRAHHPGARIVGLTTRPFAPLLRASPWFDEVRVDRRAPWWKLRDMLELRRDLLGFDLVYDLQTSSRSSRYRLLAGRPAWSGIAAGASLPHANPARDAMHTVERQREQLAMAGVPAGPAAELGWITRSIRAVRRPYALLVPGAAPHRPGKRWPAERFGALAAEMKARGLNPIVLGTAAEAPLAAAIKAVCPAAVDMTGETSLQEVGGLAARAAVAVGNDTGPMHLAAAVGCRCVVLFGGESDPALTAPRGKAPGQVEVIRVAELADLAVERVAAALP